MGERSEDACHRVADIRAWRGHTEGLYGLPHYPSDPPMVTNNKGWWRDVDVLLRRVDDLENAMEVIHELSEGFFATEHSAAAVLTVESIARHALRDREVFGRQVEP